MIDASWYQEPPGVPVQELAGGLVVRPDDGRWLIALIREGAHAGYSLPKGHVESGETLEDAARREVEEETGLRDLVVLGGMGTRERLNFTKRAWNVTHYFGFLASSDNRGAAEWFPVDALPVMFWPEQRDLLEHSRGALTAAAQKSSVREQFTRRAAAYAQSASHRGDEDLPMLLDHLALAPSDRALDIATGSGFTAAALARTAQFVVGIDLTRRMLDEARALATEPRLHWVQADAEALPFAPASFSVVTVRRAPHHFSDVGRALAEMLRVVSPGGRLGIIDQVPPEDAAGRALMERLEVLRDPSHVRALAATEWLQRLRALGAVVEFTQVVEQSVTFDAWLELAGADQARVEQINATLVQASPATRAQIGETGQVPHRLVKRWIVLVARRS